MTTEREAEIRAQLNLRGVVHGDISMSGNDPVRYTHPLFAMMAETLEALAAAQAQAATYREALAFYADVTIWSKDWGDEAESDRGTIARLALGCPKQDDLPLMERFVSELDPSLKLLNRTLDGGILLVEELCNRTAQDLLGIRGFGKGLLEETRRLLGRHGLHLKGDEPWAGVGRGGGKLR